MKAAFLTVLLLSQSLLILNADPQISGEGASRDLVTQNDTKILGDCSPVSMVNFLEIAGGGFKRALSNLGGETNTEKALSLIKSIEGRKTPEGQLYFDSRTGWGIPRPLILPLFKEIIADPKTFGRMASGELSRNDGEDHKIYVERVHRVLSSSIEAGIPVFTVIKSIKTVKKEDFFWEPVSSHSIVIVGVSELGDGDLGFSFRYCEPQPGRLHAGFFHSSHNRIFSDNVSDESGAKVWRHHPFLIATLPNTNLSETDVPWQTRTVIYPDFFILNSASFQKDAD